MRRLAIVIAVLLLGGAARLIAQPVVGDTTKQTTPSQFIGMGRDSSEIWSRLNDYYRLRATLLADSLALRHYLDSLDYTPMAIMRRNLAMSYRDWAPSLAEMARRDEDIKRSQGWDKVFANIPRVGISVPTAGIFRALGLVEDVTPRISYVLRRTDHITVRVYDLRGRLVRTIIDGIQAPGEYSFDWDLLDAEGNRVDTGDFVAEVILEAPEGRQLLLRKRIEAP